MSLPRDQESGHDIEQEQEQQTPATHPPIPPLPEPLPPQREQLPPPLPDPPERCSICFEPITSLCYVHPCRHSYDYACISPWLAALYARGVENKRYSPDQLTCPICRGIIRTIERIEPTLLLIDMEYHFRCSHARGRRRGVGETADSRDRVDGLGGRVAVRGPDASGGEGGGEGAGTGVVGSSLYDSRMSRMRRSRPREEGEGEIWGEEAIMLAPFQYSRNWDLGEFGRSGRLLRRRGQEREGGDDFADQLVFADDDDSFGSALERDAVEIPRAGSGEGNTPPRSRDRYAGGIVSWGRFSDMMADLHGL